MKLWIQGAVLIGLPLLFQVVFSALLVSNLKNIETAVNRETTSKKVLSTCRELRLIADQFMLSEFAQRYTPPQLTKSIKATAWSELHEQIKVLDSLGGVDDASKQAIDQYKHDVLKLCQLISYAESNATPDHRMALARFADQFEYYEELSSSISELLADDKRIKEHFTPIVQEFSPRASRDRQQLISLITFGIVGDVLLAAGLAVFYGKKTLARFSLLTDNIKSFSSGLNKLTVLEGNDELADLGKSFNEMAQTKLCDEELRSTLLAMVSHDLRSPLSSCSIRLGTLVEKDPESLSPSALRQIRRVNSELMRLVRMADGLLTVGRSAHESIVAESSMGKLDDIVDPTLNATRGLADAKDIVIETVLDGEMLVYCDRDKIIQVLVNLLSNAIKFAPMDSVVRLHASQQSSGVIRFEIFDQGPGISPVDKDRLFRKFSQLDQPQEIKSTGSGLGLYISRLLIAAHGGEIGYFEPSEGGSCFWFELPLPASDS